MNDLQSWFKWDPRGDGFLSLINVALSVTIEIRLERDFTWSAVGTVTWSMFSLMLILGTLLYVKTRRNAPVADGTNTAKLIRQVHENTGVYNVAKCGPAIMSSPVLTSTPDKHRNLKTSGSVGSPLPHAYDSLDNKPTIDMQWAANKLAFGDEYSAYTHHFYDEMVGDGRKSKICKLFKILGSKNYA